MPLGPDEPEVVMSLRRVTATLPITGAPELPVASTPVLKEEVKCVRFCGSRFTETVLVFRHAMAEKLERLTGSPPTGAHFESALRATFPDVINLQARAAALEASIDQASKTLAPPFDAGVSRSEIMAREVVDLVVRVDTMGTQFWLDATLPGEQEVSLLFSAFMLSVLNKDLN